MTRDVAHGPGVRYTLADGAVTVELFPPYAERRTGIVRLATADTRQEFYRQPPPALRDDGLVFASDAHTVALSPTGRFATAQRIFPERRQEPSDAPKGNEEGSDTPGGDWGPQGRSVASGRAFQNALPESEDQPRVAYSGRLGTDPRTKTTPKGKFVMEFPVAVAVEGSDKPDWRSTVVFDEKARKLDGVLHKGSSVDVVAYEHRKVSRDAKTGTRRERREYYATAVTPKLPRCPGNDADRGEPSPPATDL